MTIKQIGLYILILLGALALDHSAHIGQLFAALGHSLLVR